MNSFEFDELGINLFGEMEMRICNHFTELKE
jgi:hypothetical protein